jgi:MRG
MFAPVAARQSVAFGESVPVFNSSRRNSATIQGFGRRALSAEPLSFPKTYRRQLAVARSVGQQASTDTSVSISNDSGDMSASATTPDLGRRVHSDESGLGFDEFRQSSVSTSVGILGLRVPADESTSSSNISRRTRSTRRNPIPTWSIPGHADWDVMKVLKSDDMLALDPLLTLPKPSHSYLNSQGKLKGPFKYAPPPKVETPPHPTLVELKKNGNYTAVHWIYYRDMELDRKAPIAGIAPPDPRNSVVRGYHNDCDLALGFVPALTAFCDNVMTNDALQEESFHAKPAVKLIIPDHIKAILVDDWENVTKNLQLVPLPAAQPVNSILNDYLQYEKPRRQAGSASADILDEVVAGLKEYFEKCLGRILLYR